MLVSLLRRNGNDYTLPNGSAYPYSETNTDNALLKGSTFLRDDLRISASFIAYDTSGLQPYDATGGASGIGGNVVRAVNDRTFSTTLNYEPGGRWVNLRATAGYGKTYLHDQLIPGLSTLTTPYPPGAGIMNDYYDYNIWNVDIANNSAIGQLGGGVKLNVLTGLQFESNARDVTRLTQNPAYNAPNSIFYPNGFNASQPPGTKVNYAAYVQTRFEIGRLGLVPGLRWDRYNVEAGGATVDQLDLYDQPSTVSYTKVSPSFGASFQLLPNRLLAFYNYGQAFRPPLIDEVFSQFKVANNAIFSRCNPLVLGSLAPASGICGDLYKPEESTSQEIGLSFTQPGFVNPNGILSAKITYFWNHTDQLLESLTVVSPGVVGQPGWEKRHGVEVEGSMDTGAVFARANYSRMEGTSYTCPGIWCLPPPFAQNGLLGYYPLLDIPGETMGLTLGARFFGQKLEVSGGVQRVGSRTVVQGLTPLNQFILGTQAAYTLYGASVRYSVNRHLELRITGENLTNETYFLNIGPSQGAQAPGRNVWFTVTATY